MRKTIKKYLSILLLVFLLTICVIPCAQAFSLNAKVAKNTRIYAKASKKSRSRKIRKGVGVKVTGIYKGCARVKVSGKTCYMSVGALKVKTKTKSQKAAAIALAQCGKPYGKGSGKFNCSSLVNYAFSKAGISLSGDVRSLSKKSKLKLVHSTKLKTGDLIFIDEDNNNVADHVAIYLTGGTVVEASHGYGKVRTKKLNNWYKSHIICIRRA